MDYVYQHEMLKYQLENFRRTQKISIYSMYTLICVRFVL